MTHACCSDCRLRFTAITAAQLASCPQCGGPLQVVPGLEAAVGFRLFKLEDLPHAPLPEALAVSLPAPDPMRPRS
jgi:hypothetical protein